MGNCEAIPVAAGDVSGDWGAGGGVWGAADCDTVADFQGDCRLGRKSKLKVESSKPKKEK
jgi:hypothetical protein